MVSTGVDAIKAWEAEPFDLIIDNQMPEMGGVEAAKRIRARELVLNRPRTLLSHSPPARWREIVNTFSLQASRSALRNSMRLSVRLWRRRGGKLVSGVYFIYVTIGTLFV